MTKSFKNAKRKKQAQSADSEVKWKSMVSFENNQRYNENEQISKPPTQNTKANLKTQKQI